MSSSATNKTAMPSSPFFKPSFPETVIVEESISTPRGRHHRKINVEITTIGTPTNTNNNNKNVVQEHKSGQLGCAANMMTCIVGSGIVGLPYAMRETGFIAGIILILLTATLTEKSLRLLVETAKHLHKQSYETVAEVTFGIIGFRFILINMFIMAYGAMVTYLMITKSCISLLVGVDDVTQQQILLLIISLCIQLPLACMRDMADLDKTSSIAVAIDISIVGLVAWSSPWYEMKGVEENNLVDLLKFDIIHPSTLFTGVGVLSFAFECQEACFLVAGSLERPTVSRWARVTSMTLTACVILALACALTGYLGYGNVTKGNILENLNPTASTTFLAHGMLGMTMFATYPLASFVARHVCVVLLFDGPKAHEGGDDSSILNRPDRRILLTLALYILAMIPATIYTDMGKVLALAGVIGGSCLAYIGPGMLYIAVHGGQFLKLVDAYFSVPTNNSSNTNSGDELEARVASETTALVGQTAGSELGEIPRSIDGFLKTILWYLGSMPLWCFVAKIGNKNVLEHARKVAARNTLEQLRIGDVDHSVIEKLVENRNSHAGKKNSTIPSTAHLIRPRSDPSMAINLTGDVLQSRNKADKKHKSQSLEADPQERPPAWRDYFVAIFYVCFGCIALFAGLVSIGQSNDDSVADAVLPAAPNR